MWGYDLDARVSEHTAPEKGQEDHCLRAGDLVFGATCDAGEVKIRGDNLPANLTAQQVYGCWVKPWTQKTGAIVKSKSIGRRTVEESRFLDDLVEWLRLSGVRTVDKLFTRYSRRNGDKEQNDGQSDLGRDKGILHTRGLRSRLFFVLFPEERRDNAHDLTGSARGCC